MDIKILTALLTKPNVDIIKIYYEIAKIHEEQQNYKKAIEYYNAYLNIHYVNDLLYDRALCYIKTGDLNLAIKDLEKYLSTTQNALAYNYLGCLYNKTNNITNAIECLNKSINLDELFLDSYELLFDILLKANEPTLAIETLNKAIVKTSDIYKKQILVIKIANTYFELEMYEKAKTLYAQLLKSNDDLQIINKLSFCLIQLCDFENSFKYLKYILKIDSQNYDALETIGFYFYYIKFDYADALKYYIRALKINPSNIASIINVASCYKKLHMLEDSINFYNEAYKKTTEKLKRDKDNCYLYLLHANILLGLDNFEESVRFFQKCIDISTDNKTCFYSNCYLSYFGMAKLYESIGDFQNAMYYINKSLSISNNIMLKYFYSDFKKNHKKTP